MHTSVLAWRNTLLACTRARIVRDKHCSSSFDENCSGYTAARASAFIRDLQLYPRTDHGHMESMVALPHTHTTSSIPPPQQQQRSPPQPHVTPYDVVSSTEYGACSRCISLVRCELLGRLVWLAGFFGLCVHAPLVFDFGRRRQQQEERCKCVTLLGGSRQIVEYVLCIMESIKYDHTTLEWQIRPNHSFEEEKNTRKTNTFITI